MGEASTSAPHTLFMRGNCKYCSLILREIDAAELRGEFRIVDIDRDPVDITRIRAVPTIVADHQHMLQGRDAFAWVNNKKVNVVKAMPYSSGKCSWDSMSCAFTFIDENNNDIETTNSGMSTVFTSITSDTASPPNESNTRIPNERNSGRGAGVGDAMERLMAQRNTEYQAPQRQGGIA